MPLWYWKATLKTCSGHWGDGFIPDISGVRANDFAQLMREKFRVKVCEHVDWIPDNSKILRGKNGMERRTTLKDVRSGTTTGFG